MQLLQCHPRSPFRAFLRKRFSNRSSSIKLLPSRSWKRSSFDHFVGAGEQRRRDSEAERYARKNSPSLDLRHTLFLQLLYPMVVIIGDCRSERHRSGHSDLS
jgi:hypothetical protein